MIEAPEFCPVCNGELRCSSPETADEYPEWEYECGLILQRHESGKLYPEFVCREATVIAIDRMNATAARTDPTDNTAEK